MAVKPILADQTVTAIWGGDPAIDHTHVIVERDDDGQEIKIPSVLRYIDTAHNNPGAWRDLLQMKPGEQPTEFVIGIIPPAELTRIEDDARWGTQNVRSRTIGWECFKAALVDVKNGPADMKDGKPHVPKSGGRVDPKWIDGTFTKGLRRVAIDIGVLAYRWNQLGDDDAKN